MTQSAQIYFTFHSVIFTPQRIDVLTEISVHLGMVCLDPRFSSADRHVVLHNLCN
jgi:hypothetical protein